MLNCFEEYEKLDKIQLLSTTRVLTKSQVKILLDYYQPCLSQPHPSQAVQTIMLYLLSGEEFDTLYKKQAIRAIRKGIPSFFRSIRSVLNLQPEKVSIVISILYSLSQ